MTRVVSRALGFMAKLTATGEQQEERGDLLGNMCQQLFRLMKVEEASSCGRSAEALPSKITFRVWTWSASLPCSYEADTWELLDVVGIAST
ncbi:unnamed protein product [Effrenium voratum]|uniref:Uncharacterized protein n=1 Tax=Effrenium voratum TaxID=2562239 RepID=A0AA36MUY1_9DINO|nr:unnamed protein product [Effrenium voratum]